MTHQTTDVYRYLIFLQKYLTGDLKQFERLSIEAEKRENSSHKTSPVNRTTKNPYSFEFIYGDQLISRSTIPHTTVLFSTLDILGFLTRTGKDYGKTYKNFLSFNSGLQPALPILQLNILRNVFRHGICHNYFPKLNMEISYHSSNPTNVMFFKNHLGDLVLNVNYLKTTVVSRLNDIINDTKLYPKMDQQYAILIKAYEADIRTDIENLKASI